MRRQSPIVIVITILIIISTFGFVVSTGDAQSSAPDYLRAKVDDRKIKLFWDPPVNDDTLFVDRFTDGTLSEYMVVEGEKDDWYISQKIDGNSLDADMGDTGDGTIILKPDRYSWSGNRTIEADFKCNTDYWKKNAMIVFYDNGLQWTARIGVQGDEINLLNSEEGGVVKKEIEVSDDDLHHLKVRIQGKIITVSLDGSEIISYENKEKIGAGTAGLKTGGGSIEHETWFDNFKIYSKTNKSSNIEEYKIYQGLDFKSLTHHESVDDNTTSYADTGLTNGQTYYYQVSAVNNAGESEKSDIVSATPTSETPTNGYTQGGLTGEYYDNWDFTDLKVIRDDSTVNFDWEKGSPDERIDADRFSVRWTGKVRIDHAANYTIYTSTDDGVRLWVDGQKIIEDWHNHPPRENAGTVKLEKGYHTIEMEYYENEGGAVARLYWSTESIEKTIIPANHLYYSADGSEDIDCDGILDSDDADIDGDGIPNRWEKRFGLNITDPSDADDDDDGDGYTNLAEYKYGTDPNEAESRPIDVDRDTDGDGVPNYKDPDDDGDGLPDAWEEVYGLDRIDPSDDADRDDDGYSNLKEYKAGTSPTDPSSYPSKDDDVISTARTEIESHWPTMLGVLIILSLLIWGLVSQWRSGGGTVASKKDMDELPVLQKKEPYGEELPVLTSAGKTEETPNAVAGESKTIEVGEEIELDASMSEHSKEITGFEWTFDGSEVKKGKRVTKEFAQPGVYRVELKVIGKDGNTGTDEVDIQVREGEIEEEAQAVSERREDRGMDKIEGLKEMREKDLITDEQFRKRKKHLLRTTEKPKVTNEKEIPETVDIAQKKIEGLEEMKNRELITEEQFDRRKEEILKKEELGEESEDEKDHIDKLDEFLIESEKHSDELENEEESSKLSVEEIEMPKDNSDD